MRRPKDKEEQFSPGKFGFSQAQWAMGKKEMRDILAGIAAQRSTISYSKLSESLLSIRIGYHDPAMATILEHISRDEELNGRGMLSVLVVHKQGDIEPGNGFYELALTLGKDVSNHQEFWI